MRHEKEGALETIYFAGGCLWGVQAYIKTLPGVLKQAEQMELRGVLKYRMLQVLKSIRIIWINTLMIIAIFPRSL